MKMNCVLKKTNVHQTNVYSDTPKHANTSSETEFAGMEKDALMRIKESVLKIRKLKKLRKKHGQEVNTIKNKINKLKEHISVMEDKII